MTPWPVQRGIGLLLGTLALLAGGCQALKRPTMHESLLTSRKTTRDVLSSAYVIRCPDLIDLCVEGRAECSGRFPIGADGRLALPIADPPRLEGLGEERAAEVVAERLGVPRDKVWLAVAEYRSQQIYLFGEIKGHSRAVPYQGPETVLELLQRVGGLTSGADVGDVQVVRAHVADGRQPEVFHVDLRAALTRNDHQANPRLQPFDQIHVGQSRPSSTMKCLPPWLQPLYRQFAGLSRSDHPAEHIALLPRRRNARRMTSDPRPLQTRGTSTMNAGED